MFSYSRNSRHCVETEGLFPQSQVPASCPNPNPVRSSPCLHTPLPKNPSYLWAFLVQTPNTPRTKSHVSFSLHRSISPGMRLTLWLFHNIICFYTEELLATRPTTNLEDTRCRLSTTSYSIYSQLPSILESFLHSQPEEVAWRGDLDPLITVSL